MSVEVYIWLLVSILVAILLGGTIFYILMLRWYAIRHERYYGEFTKALITGLAGGTVVYIATKLEGIFSSGITIGSIISMLIVFLFAFFIMLLGVGLYVAISRRLENQE